VLTLSIDLTAPDDDSRLQALILMGGRKRGGVWSGSYLPSKKPPLACGG